nr:EOG090X04F1 [Sida crystallina]
MSIDSDLQRKIVDILNDEIGSDLKHLSRLKDLYVDTVTVQNSLKEKLSLISTEAPTKIQKFEEVKTKSASHLKESGLLLDELKDKLSMVDKYEHQRFYLECVKIIESMSDKLQQFVQLNQDMEAVQLYNDMVLFSGPLQKSNCHHLINYMNQTALFWFSLLKEKFRKELQESLKMIQWPLISSNQEVLQTAPTQDVMSKFQLQFQCLWMLKIPPKHRAVEELLHPLKKRFAYHFSGNRPTNKRDKPEWYLRQILQWIGDHIKFIETYVQPVYNQEDALMEFSKGLVQLAVEKLAKDSPAILSDDAILAHTIGEVLNFETELRSSYNYPSSQPSPLLVLTQPHFFSRWIALEKAFAVEKMDILLSSDKAWSCATSYDSSEDDNEDDVRLTECAEGFLQMLIAITERYKPLPQPGHRLQFLDLQLDLLDEFRIRLLQLARQDAFLDIQLSTKTTPNMCTILNTVAAIINALDDWSDSLLFLQLYSHKIQTESVERQAAQAMNSSETIFLPSLRAQAQSNEDVAEGSVFEGIMALLKRMQEDLLRKVVEAVMLEVKAKSQPYRLDKWAALPNPEAYIQPSLSPTGSAMLQAVAFGLQWLQKSLASHLFRDAWQELAAQVNEFLLEELILQRQFNDGGTAQLCYDIQQNLIQLFSQFTKYPESYFRELKDACTLLRLPRPINLLLIDTLSQSVQLDESNASTKNSRAIANRLKILIANTINYGL